MKNTNFTNIKVLINIYVNKIVVSNKFPFSKNDSKYFIDYKDAKNIRLLCKFFPKTSAYRRDFNKAKCMYFLIKDKNCCKNIMKLGKISNIVKNEFDRKPVINEKYIETKINSYNKPTQIFTITKNSRRSLPMYLSISNSI